MEDEVQCLTEHKNDYILGKPVNKMLRTNIKREILYLLIYANLLSRNNFNSVSPLEVQAVDKVIYLGY